MFLKRLLFLFLWGLCSSGVSYAQVWVQEYHSLYDQAMDHNNKKNWEGGILFFNKAYELALLNKDTLLSVKAGIRKADNMISADQLTDAKSLLTNLDQLINDEISSGLHAELVYLIGSATYRLGDFDNARKAYEKGLGIADSSSDAQIFAELSLFLANVLIFSAEYELGHKLSSRAIRIFRQLGDEDYLSRANLSKYIIYLYQGNLEEGRTFLLESYNYAEATNDPSLLRDSYLYLSDFYNRKNDHSLAITFSERGLALAEELGQDLYKVRYYYTLGNIYLKQSEPDRALSYFNRAHQYYESVGSTGLAIDILLKVAECFALKKDYEVAEKLLLDALHYYNDKE